jgi:O-antigen ligase
VAAKGDTGLSRASLALPSVGTASAVAAAGAAAGLLLVAVIQAAGPLGALAPVVLVLGLLLMRFPGVALGLLLASAVLIEGSNPGIIPPVGAFYDVVGDAILTPQDFLLLAGLGGVLLRFASERETTLRLRLPEPLTASLILLLVALVGGAATGYYADVPVGEIFHRSMTVFYVIGVPLLVVNVVRDTRALLLFAGIAAALATFKGFSGLYTALAGVGETVEEGTITYLNPVPNMIMMLFVLGVAGALVRRVTLPGWMLAGAPLALLALVLSYRRSFWIAAAFALIVVVIVASQRRGRAVIVVATIALALTLGATQLFGSSDPSGSPLIARAKTISPSGVESNRGDRYRIDERRNVIENVREHPLTGIGLGVPWTVHDPLAEDHDRRYVHFALLWYWLAFGLLGVAAYLAVLASGLWAAVGVWRRHPNPQVQIVALACFGGIVALLVVELTATFTGVEPRASLLIGALLGWLAAAWADLPKQGRESPIRHRLPA